MFLEAPKTSLDPNTAWLYMQQEAGLNRKLSHLKMVQDFCLSHGGIEHLGFGRKPRSMVTSAENVHKPYIYLYTVLGTAWDFKAENIF